MKYLNPRFNHLAYGFCALVFAAAFLLAGCSNNTSVEEPNPQITDALIQLDGAEDEATIETGETVKFTGFTVTESGDRVPLSDLNENWSWEWESSDAAVFTVDAEGNAVGEKEGEAFCVLRLNGPDISSNNSYKPDGSFTTAGNPSLPPELYVPIGMDSLFVTFLN